MTHLKLQRIENILYLLLSGSLFCGSGLKRLVSAALGITDTRSAGTLARNTVFSFLGDGRQD